MANKIVLKNSAIPSKAPTVADLAYGELAINYADGKIYYKTTDNTINSFNAGTGATTLDGLTDVAITGASTGQVLKYNGTTWINDTDSGGGGTWGSITGTLSDQTDLQTELNSKQATLVSGTNIKTVNSTSLLGSGNLAVQPTLVSGTNIKTINGTSLLGSGNIDITDTGATTLDGLTDVAITGASTGQVLKYNGTTWINGEGSGGPSGFEQSFLLMGA